MARPGPLAARTLGTVALLAGALVLAWIAPRRNPWDLERLSGGGGRLELDVWGIPWGLPAWAWAAAALGLAVALLAAVARLARARGRAGVWLGLGGAAALLVSLLPTAKGWEIVTGLALGSLAAALVTAGLLALRPSLGGSVLAAGERAAEAVLGVPRGRFLVLVFGFVFAAAGLGSYFVFGHVPHVVDGADQLFHARMLATGRLTVPPPPAPEFFEFPHMILGERWYSQYPPGHTLLLAAGLLVGAPWLVNPLAGALSAVVLYFLGREAYGEVEGRLAALLAAGSPFLLLMSSSHMNHAPTLLFLELFLLGAVRMARRGRPADGLLAGAALGYALTIRALTAAAVALPFALYLAGRWLRLALAGDGRAARRLLAAGLAAALALAVPLSGLLAFNQLTNGDPLVFGYQAAYGADALPGFGKSGWWSRPHTPLLGLEATLRNLNALNQYLFGLPLPSLAFALLGLAWLRLRVWDGLLLAAAASLAGAYFFYWFQDWAYGPRFLYSAIAPLALVSARALLAFPRFAAERAPGRGRRWTAAMLVFLAVAWLYGLAVHGPMFAGFYGRNYGAGNRALLAVTERIDRPSLVFVPRLYFPTLFPQNDPLLRGPAIWALDLGPEKNRELRSLYPGRTAYRLSALDGYVLVEVGDGEPADGRIWPLAAGEPLVVEAATFQMSHFAGGRWSDERTAELGRGWKNHDHLRLEAQAPGAEVGLLVAAARAERRTLRLALSHGPDLGVAEVVWNREPVATVDLYAPRPAVRSHAVGEVRLDPGTNGVLLRVVGRNQRASGYGMGVDYISLE